MSLDDIGDRLDRRFRLLTGGSRTAMERQGTLRGTVDWSYELLDGLERTVFDRLSVFVGGFTLEAAEAVAGGDRDPLEVDDAVARLVDKSMGDVDRRRPGRYAQLLPSSS